MKTEKNVLNEIFEQYEYKNWLITITNYLGTSKLIGFATPTKYAHLLDIYNYNFSDEIAKEQGWKLIEHNENNNSLDDYYYEGHEDFCYIVAEPDDICINFLNNVDTEKSTYILNYLVKEILCYEKAIVIEKNQNIIILKQIQKKSITPKVGKTKRGFLHVAWASLVKDRDKKCTECGSVYDLHAHHIKQYKTHPELRNDVNNGITLCGCCHRKWHSENGK